MSKHKRVLSDKKLMDVCKKATLAEKRAGKLVKKALRGAGRQSVEHGNDKKHRLTGDNGILESALLAEKKAERLVKMTLSQIGR